MAVVTATAARPLAGRRVLNPRANHQAAELSDRIRALGGEPVEAPTIAITPGDTRALADAMHELASGRFRAVCLTSPNGVGAVADVLAALQLDPVATFARADLVACVGPGTARALVDRCGVAVDLLPTVSTTAALGAAFPAGTGRVLLARAELADPALATMLADRGYDPVEVVAYRTVAPPALPDQVLGALTDGAIDLIAFASPSQVHNFATLTATSRWRGQVVSIGPVTSAACREHGIPVAVEAEPHDLDGLVGALVAAASPG